MIEDKAIRRSFPKNIKQSHPKQYQKEREAGTTKKEVVTIIAKKSRKPWNYQNREVLISINKQSFDIADGHNVSERDLDVDAGEQF